MIPLNLQNVIVFTSFNKYDTKYSFVDAGNESNKETNVGCFNEKRILSDFNCEIIKFVFTNAYY